MWDFIFIVSEIIFIISLFIMSLSNSDKIKGTGQVLSILSVIGIMLAITYDSRLTFNTKKYTYSTQIKNTIINDSIIKCDTFHIIMPKKK